MNSQIHRNSRVWKVTRFFPSHIFRRAAAIYAKRKVHSKFDETLIRFKHRVRYSHCTHPTKVHNYLRNWYLVLTPFYEYSKTSRRWFKQSSKWLESLFKYLLVWKFDSFRESFLEICQEDSQIHASYDPVIVIFNFQIFSIVNKYCEIKEVATISKQLQIVFAWGYQPIEGDFIEHLPWVGSVRRARSSYFARLKNGIVASTLSRVTDTDILKFHRLLQQWRSTQTDH